MWRRLTLKGKLAGEICRHISYRKSGEWQMAKMTVREVLGEIREKKIKKSSLTVGWGFCTFRPKPNSSEFHKKFRRNSEEIHNSDNDKNK